VSEGATGEIRLKCKRSTCKRLFTVKLPLPEGEGEATAGGRPAVR
jgi:hypothetical protein